MKLSTAQINKFQAYILRWYAMHGRHTLPWRQTTNPYHILVSELMLQQTQVERVIPKYLAFLERFPTVETLSESPLSEVLKLWQGLGYNRRAKFLWQTAREVATTHQGAFPQNTTSLQQLPGIGPYTASAVATFAFNHPVVVVETNIRSIFLYHFFPNQSEIRDKQLEPLIKQTLWQHNPREWYAALMDYGSHLKKVLPNPSRKSNTYAKQSRFEGSLRQVRGAIIRALTAHSSLTLAQLKEQSTGNSTHFEDALSQLIAEKMVSRKNDSYHLADHA